MVENDGVDNSDWIEDNNKKMPLFEQIKNLDLEKCDIFSLGMILLKIYLDLSDNDLKDMELNLIDKNPSDVN